MSNSLFSSLGLLFFATWSLIVCSVTVAALGRDLMPAVARSKFRKPPQVPLESNVHRRRSSNPTGTPSAVSVGP
jgi:hypothetical protein